MNTFGHAGLVRVRAGQPEVMRKALDRALDLAVPVGYAMGIQRILGVRAQFPDEWIPLTCVRALAERLRLASQKLHER